MRSKSPADFVYDSTITQILIALAVNGLYGLVLGLSLLPSAIMLRAAIMPAISDGAGFVEVFRLAMAAGLAVFAYFLWGALVQAALVRLISAGIRPGRYPKASLTTLRWLVYSGIYNLALRSILPFIPVSWFSTAFFKIVGARIGKNVYINTPFLNDAYLVTIEDDVIVGGGAEISCHIMERDHLVLRPIRIGESSLIGTGAYLSPGTEIGARCVVGARCYLRMGTKVPDGSVLTVLAGMPMREAFALEKKGSRRKGGAADRG